MDNKVSSTLEKALQDKSKGNFQKALKRLDDAIGKYPDEIELYLEAADVCLEGGESIQSTQYIKKAHAKFRSETNRLDSFAREKLKSTNDPVLGKFLLENAIKKRTLDDALELLQDLQDRAVRELLQRTRTKKQSLTSAARGAYAFKAEALINAMSEALLCLRLGRMKESIRSFLQILDEKPVENEILEPFFAALQKAYPKAGRVRYAYACSLLNSQQYEKATSTLVTAVQMDPKIGEDCLDRLRELSGKFETPPESIRQALIEILMVTGDVVRAAELLEETLSTQPERARGVLELVGPHLENTDNNLVLHYLYMEAALLSDQTARALEILKSLNKDESRRPDLLEWLDTKSKAQFLPSEILVFYGEMAADAGNVDGALEIFEAVANNSHADIPTIVNVLEKHKHNDPRVAEFVEKHHQAPSAPAGYDSDGFEFEHFENNEFKFSNGSPDDPAAEPATENNDSENDPAETADRSEEEAPENIESDNEQETDETAGVVEEEPSQATPRDAGSADIVWEEEDDLGAVNAAETNKAEQPDAIEAETEDDSWLDTQNDSIMSGGDDARPRLSPSLTLDKSALDEDSGENEAAADSPPVYEIDEEHVRNLSGALRNAGATLFFHVEDDSAETIENEPEIAVETEPPIESGDEPEIAVETEPPIESEDGDETSEEHHEDESKGNDFEHRFAMFLDHKLDNNDTLALLQEALAAEKLDELRELLYFEPENDEEDYLKKRYQIEYFLYKDLPVRALEILNGINPGTIPAEYKKEMLSKKADCQQKMSDFEGAHETYTILLEEYASPEIEQKAKRNYEQYLRDQCDRKPVLEKITSLTGD